eukprot:m.74928 g.74928  ORF g.74928 m.74928 type:complete len:873 (-) comp24718_c0_seq2:61-2679(-)
MNMAHSRYNFPSRTTPLFNLWIPVLGFALSCAAASQSGATTKPNRRLGLIVTHTTVTVDSAPRQLLRLVTVPAGATPKVEMTKAGSSFYFTPDIEGEYGFVNFAGTNNSETVGVWRAIAEHQLDAIDTLPAIAGPVVNGILLGDGGLGDAQPLSKLGYLDVTKPPFNADPTGTTDATKALQQAIDFGRQAYLTVLVPSGTFKVSATLNMIDPQKLFYTTVGTPFCNNMQEIYPSPKKNITQQAHCSRTAPAILRGPNRGPPPTIVLTENSNLVGPVIYVHNPLNENINMNQVVSNINIKIEDGNTQAYGIYARAAQGTSVQDVTIFAGTSLGGLMGGAGSGGSHIGVTVIGGGFGMDVSSSQPSPTLTGITLINQTQSAVIYNTGRQTLSIVGATIHRCPTSVGPAISSINAPVSIADSVLTQDGGSDTIGIQATGNLFAVNTFLKGFDTLVDYADAEPALKPKDSGTWSRLQLFARPAPSNTTRESTRESPWTTTSPVFINGTKVPGTYQSLDAVAPTMNTTSKHIWPTLPLRESLCNVKDFGAKGDYDTDDTHAIQTALDHANCTSGVFFPKGYFAVTATLQLPTNAVLLGVSRIYSNIVPHKSVVSYAAPQTPPWPLVQTGSGAESSTTVCALSVLVWHHLNSTFAIKWKSSGGYWREAHINRVDVNPGIVGPGAHYNIPLMLIENGGGRFYNFYQENWDYQGPKYRHLLVNGTSFPLHFYHLNTEHSKGEANSEFVGVKAPLRIYGFKAEGNFVQLWFRDCEDVLLLGYGGNASPFPTFCHYPPGYVQYTPPSLIRIENTKKFAIANLISQLASKAVPDCGTFTTGFAGNFYDPSIWKSIFEVSAMTNFSTPPLQWPVMYARGDLNFD